MRTLKFIVDGRNLIQDPSCDFTGLFPSESEKLTAEFQFSNEWGNALKVSAFYSVLGAEYPPQVLDEEDRCVIPREASMRPVFRMQILGEIGGSIVQTNVLSIYQKGGKK